MKRWQFVHACVQDAVDNFTSGIHLAAEISVSKSSGKYRQPPVPWWSDKCQQAARVRKAALKIVEAPQQCDIHPLQKDTNQG